MTTQDEIASLSSLIDLERDLQQNAVRWALGRLLGAGQCGVVLADEVGCGKTYEALALLALLWHHYETTNPIRRVLILCKSSLLRKWHEELTANETGPAKHGLRPYLKGERWEPFVEQFIHHMVMIENLHRAERMWWGKDGEFFQGVREDHKIQVPDGLYLVNHQLLYDSKRYRSKPLKYLHRSNWDLVIVDEAHHYGKGNKCDSIFATPYQGLGRGEQPDFGAEDTLLSYRHILLLTATPFELEPGEMLNLLRIARAEKDDLDQLSDLLRQYQRALNLFYDLRALPPSNLRRQAVVEHLRGLRQGGDGLEALMRRYVVRNRKEGTERQYALVNQSGPRWEKQPFDKFEDLKSLVARSPLIPFSGPDALFYLELRTLIQEVIEARSGDEGARGTFVAMDLQQGLSSYPQLLARSDVGKPSRLLESNRQRARRLRRLLTEWDASGRLHPKVSALADLVTAIIEDEIHAVEHRHLYWFAKVVVFSKLVAGTAPHLRQVLADRLQPLVEKMLERLARSSVFGNAETLHDAAQRLVREETKRAYEKFTQTCKERDEFKSCLLKAQVLQDAGFGKVKHATHAIEVFRPYFQRRAGQVLFLVDFLRRGAQPLDECTLRDFICEYLINPAVAWLDETIDKYLDTRPDLDEASRLDEAARYETGVRRLSLLRERLQNPEIVARYDGKKVEERESYRINFNERWSPLVLIVSRVGEEGIDLQKQARYILHYDLEWNPAKMEQREGRVDREGYRQDYADKDEPIDVRFFLLKGTYEERIFHTVMQRDQWFQILMGAQRRKLGRPQQDDEGKDFEADDALLQETKEAEHSIGSLTPYEKEAVMLDLQPA
jgi:superfamily II DNA or RNA helicase